MGVPKQMPLVSQSGYGNNNVGIQYHRYKENYVMTANQPLKAPLPFTGGKSTVAAEIWARLGDTPNYVEPFMGSAAVLLARPHDLNGKTETANDIDGFLTCSYRAIQYAPDEVAYYCDRPVNEIDLTAFHLWLKAQRPDLTERLFADPFYYDAQVAGAYLWGAASWIGDGWCVADGPWINVDGKLTDRRLLPEDEQTEGVRKKIPAVHEHGTEVGIRKYTPAAVPRKMPEIGRSPNGQMAFNRKGIQAVRHQGVPKQMPMVNGARYTSTQGVQAYEQPNALAAYFARLSDRLRRVRFLCGDWKRACKDSVTVNHGLTGVMLAPEYGIFLDPPYPAAEHDMAYHSEEAGDVWYQAASWAVERGDDPRLRICVAGYYSEATDQLFPATWERLRWEARGGYANQKKDGRGRENAKREILWFSPFCLDVAAEARAAFDRPITVRDSDYTGTMFEEQA